MMRSAEKKSDKNIKSEENLKSEEIQFNDCSGEASATKSRRRRKKNITNELNNTNVCDSNLPLESCNCDNELNSNNVKDKNIELETKKESKKGEKKIRKNKEQCMDLSKSNLQQENNDNFQCVDSKHEIFNIESEKFEVPSENISSENNDCYNSDVGVNTQSEFKKKTKRGGKKHKKNNTVSNADLCNSNPQDSRIKNIDLQQPLSNTEEINSKDLKPSSTEKNITKNVNMQKNKLPCKLIEKNDQQSNHNSTSSECNKSKTHNEEFKDEYQQISNSQKSEFQTSKLSKTSKVSTSSSTYKQNDREDMKRNNSSNLENKIQTDQGSSKNDTPWGKNDRMKFQFQCNLQSSPHEEYQNAPNRHDPQRRPKEYDQGSSKNNTSRAKIDRTSFRLESNFQSSSHKRNQNTPYWHDPQRRPNEYDQGSSKNNTPWETNDGIKFQLQCNLQSSPHEKYENAPNWHDPQRRPKEYDQVLQTRKKRSEIRSVEKIKEIEGDLFEAPKEYSLAHCVAEDMRMGAGIAVGFKQQFKSLDILLSQRAKTGGLAVLEDEQNPGRFIYYLVTKPRSNGKPTMESLEKSLLKLKAHCISCKVNKLAMPRIGCGLDRLEWRDVKKLINDIFNDTDVEIVVYNFQQVEEVNRYSKPYSEVKIVHRNMMLQNIETQTGLLFICYKNDEITEEIASLDRKYHFMDEVKRTPKAIGQVIHLERSREYLYGLVIANSKTEMVDFKTLALCLRNLSKMNSKHKCEYFGIQAFIWDNDELAMEKFITLFKSIVRKVEFWVCWSDKLAYLNPEKYTY